MQSQRIMRVVREIQRMGKNPPSGISCSTREEDKYDVLEAQILGPKDTPYENGVFVVEVIITEKYPFEPPLLRFITKVYHPNIDSAGRICLDLIKMPPKGAWRPTISIESLLVALRGLLEYPNAEDPVMPSIADEYKFNTEIFNQRAKEFTLKYALQDQPTATDTTDDTAKDISSKRKRKISDEEPSTSKKRIPEPNQDLE